MSDLYTYRVLRQMDGDKQYFQGDTRDLTEVDAKHLVDLGVLKKIGKAEMPPLNKAEPAPANKRTGNGNTTRGTPEEIAVAVDTEEAAKG